MDLAPFLPGFAAAYAILLVAASSPGPAVAMLLGIGTARGRGPALVASAGIATGSVVINVITLVGVGLLLQQAGWAMTLLRLAGAAYLLWLAWGSLRKAVAPPDIRVAEVPAVSAWRYFVMGMLMQVTNPKAIAFWLAIAAVGATRGGGAWVIAAFVAGAWLISFACHGAWAVLLSAAPVRRFYARFRRWVEGALGGFMAFMAFRLATERG
ncbi:LysE family translocator [Jannaschia sp. S6380]|uniref:LysE family translocator n=1 Tax=Jannaschia sp. S6380 TaxID=2926408 RepID=UPI001FF4355A|nr:LysE family translocator [Jannaschia sp. S6380]MCK0168124.1 LysE family translocator [Jannaschia sp. S6380]